MKNKHMFEKYYSLAQSFSTQYLLAQAAKMKKQTVKFQAFREALKTRLFLEKPSGNGRQSEQ